MAGYSSSSLAKKLGIGAGCKVRVTGEPADYIELLAPLSDDVVFEKRVSRNTDLIHVFATSRSLLSRQIVAAMSAMRADAVIWVSWPKRASKVPTDITEDTIRAIALPLGLVDIKVCAVSEIWSGLKLVIRKERRAAFELGQKPATARGKSR